MNLTKVTDRVWFFPFDDTKDRPILGYIRGDKFSIAIDAGHSAEHVADFYEAIEAEGLPLPELTILTHWHWDHTFGMHAVHGLTLANRRTNRQLCSLLDTNPVDLRERVFALDSLTAVEYGAAQFGSSEMVADDGGRPMIVVPADMTFETDMTVDAGGVIAEIFTADSPHTNDGTLIYVPGEKCLFLGDAVLGVWPTGVVDQKKMDSLIATVEIIDFTYALTGHWPMSTKEELLEDMRDRVFE